MLHDVEIRAAGSYDFDTRTFTATFTAGSARTMRDAAGSFLEVIDLAGFDPAELVGRTVFLDHRHTTDAAVGTVIAARREGDSIVGEVQLSAADSVADVRTKVAEGVIGAVSIGYTVTEWREGRDASGRRTKTAVRGRLIELSLVGLGADSVATIRNEAIMEPTTEQTPPAVTPPATTEQAPPVVIRAHAAPTGSEDPAAVRELQVEALACRMSGSEPSAGARQFMGFGFAEHAAISLRAAGENVGVMSREAVLALALRGGAQGIGDYPGLLTGAGQRVLASTYAAAASPLRALAQNVLAADFRENEVLRIGGFGTLAEVSEHGEITATSTDEAGEKWRVKTYARTFALTRKALVNDDLNAFGRVTSELGKAAAETENQALAALLVSNPTMADGTALFHANHGNLGTAAFPAIEAISAGRLAMRRQTGITGELISIRPRFIVAGPELETALEQQLAEVNAIEPDRVNPFAGKLTLAIEPRLAGNRWYLFAAPAEAPVLLLGHLASAPGPQISSREGFEVLGREFRVVLDFGVAVTDFRGAFYNPGAAA